MNHFRQKLPQQFKNVREDFLGNGQVVFQQRVPRDIFGGISKWSLGDARLVTASKQDMAQTLAIKNSFAHRLNAAT